MSAPATVTEAQKALAFELMYKHSPAPFFVTEAAINGAAQLIADSEARALARLQARISSDEELFHDLRMKLTAACGDPYKLHDEALDAIIAERDQLRAEVERLRSDRDCEKRLRKDAEELREDAIARAARAERAEAEVSKLTDALDMMRDEFMRIIACPGCNAEIEDLANRAQLKLIQRVPVITQRDRAETELAKERARLDWLESDAGVDWQWNDAGGGIVFRAKIDAAMKEETK